MFQIYTVEMSTVIFCKVSYRSNRHLFIYLFGKYLLSFCIMLKPIKRMAFGCVYESTRLYAH